MPLTYDIHIDEDRQVSSGIVLGGARGIVDIALQRDFSLFKIYISQVAELAAKRLIWLR
ncbi:hypothetical protein [Pseudoalteromonas sp. R3]|uniref:hypothetical protein n=1 Tax=Pseudoalteromonas sp. R3 TaxID=1709477 RepID=UPI000AF59982|nr:hypothetical protein [Pseudoalteromonas sp. R3]